MLITYRDLLNKFGSCRKIKAFCDRYGKQVDVTVDNLFDYYKNTGFTPYELIKIYPEDQQRLFMKKCIESILSIIPLREVSGALKAACNTNLKEDDRALLWAKLTDSSCEVRKSYPNLFNMYMAGREFVAANPDTDVCVYYLSKITEDSSVFINQLAESIIGV